MNTVLDFLMKTRIKYVVIAIITLFCIILFLSGIDHQIEEEQLGVIQYKKNILFEVKIIINNVDEDA